MQDLTPDEFCEMLDKRITAQTIREWCRSGKIKCKRLGRAWLIPYEEAIKIRDEGLIV